MSEDNRYTNGKSEELESSLEDLLTLAFNKKKEKETKQGLDVTISAGRNISMSRHDDYDDQSFDTSAMNVDDIVAEANAYSAYNAVEEEPRYSATVRRIEPDAEEKEADLLSVSDEDNIRDENMSIEDMVALAMMSKKGVKKGARNVERVATEDDAISEEELSEMLKSDEMYNQLVEHKEKPKKKKWYQNTLLIVLLGIIAFFLILIVVVVVVFYHYYGKVKDDTIYVPQPGKQNQIAPDDTVDAFEYEDWIKDQLSNIADNTMSNENVTNVLIIAEDLRDTTGDSRGNTDVMILVSINKERETLTLTSFMRDIYCDIPGYYADRLNSAYAKGGPEVLMDTLQKNFGVIVDRYVLVNFYSFIDVVEAIGGIEADVTQAHINAMRDPMAEQNKIMGKPKGTDYLTKPGHYNLNGNQALAYARIRKGVGDDFGRTSRQREVIFTALNKAKELSFGEIKELVDNILDKNMVKTNLTEGEIASLLINCFEYMDYKQQQLQVPDNSTWTGVRIRGMEVLSINFLKNAKIIQETIYGESNIDLGENGGEFVNTYTPPVTTNPPITTTPPETTTPPTDTTTVPTVTTPPTDTSDTISGETTTTPEISDTGSDSSSSSDSSSDVSSDSGAVTTTPPVDTTTTPTVTAPPESSSEQGTTTVAPTNPTDTPAPVENAA
ncbi:MAG: LCP family protein [Oscillospiraceae bacterium]|nr:LCP family protein [Oscillospiraceae bacterium]